MRIAAAFFNHHIVFASIFIPFLLNLSDFNSLLNFFDLLFGLFDVLQCAKIFFELQVSLRDFQDIVFGVLASSF